jgi:hypothetical protein
VLCRSEGNLKSPAHCSRAGSSSAAGTTINRINTFISLSHLHWHSFSHLEGALASGAATDNLVVHSLIDTGETTYNEHINAEHNRASSDFSHLPSNWCLINAIDERADGGRSDNRLWYRFLCRSRHHGAFDKQWNQFERASALHGGSCSAMRYSSWNNILWRICVGLKNFTANHFMSDNRLCEQHVLRDD